MVGSCPVEGKRERERRDVVKAEGERERERGRDVVRTDGMSV